MASERQIAANRRNARRSSGPRSATGKRRSSGNALRHGLSRIINDRGGGEIDSLARLLVGANADEEFVEHALRVVRAQLDLLRIRELKRDLAERVYRLGMVDPPPPRFRSCSAEIRHVMRQPLIGPLRWPQRIDPSGPMPTDKDARAAETIRRLLPLFRKLDRYERRAFKAKQRALDKLAELRRCEPIRVSATIEPTTVQEKCDEITTRS